ncbi:MAG TPA: TlpA disulfide reductase family protein [Mycobacterium sp.]|nr:TlpA disulfide reductase family protein [Mycobacterium sp.]
MNGRLIMPNLPDTRPRLRGVLVAVVALVSLSACSGEIAADSTKGGYVTGGGAITTVPPSERKAAPELSGKDLNDRPISADKFKGKTLVVNVWGSWCPPCRKEAPALIKVSRDLKPRGVEFLGIAVRESATASKAFTDRHRVPYPSISNESGSLLIGFNSSLPTAAVPTTYVIDNRGRVAARILDAVTATTLTDVVEGVLEDS